jgi:hypothetical protein
MIFLVLNPAQPSFKEGPSMRRFALLLGVAVSLITTSAVAQNCAGFTDVLASSPFCPDVTWMKTYGITKGCTASTYCPNDSVSRLQMAAFMHRLGENPAFVDGGNAFGGPALLGTLDNSALVVIVDRQTAMQLLPAVDPVYGFNPNVVNGSSINSVAGGIAGATIAGGGGCNLGTGGTCASATMNQVTAGWGTVGGGFANTAGNFATVAGGEGNTASGLHSTVAGGYGNTASNINSTVAGGASNTASGDSSTVAGGYLNTASGNYSFAAGVDANATHDGSFVWGDGTQAANSIGANTFSVLATGGIGLYPGSAQVGIAWGGGWSCTVNSGSNWACSSDRNLKEHFQTLDLRDVLGRVVAMPVTSWTVIGHPDRRHIGPVAQDFHATFGLGDAKDDTHIDIGDSQGVALAAIQGLNAKVDEQNSLLQSRLESAVQEKSRQLEEQAATIREQQREIAELSERMQKAETLAADVAALKAALAELQRGRETVAVK